MTGGLIGIKTMMSEEEFDAGMIYCGMLQDGCTREEAVANLYVKGDNPNQMAMKIAKTGKDLDLNRQFRVIKFWEKGDIGQ